MSENPPFQKKNESKKCNTLMCVPNIFEFIGNKTDILTMENSGNSVSKCFVFSKWKLKF